ncbi:phage tail protein [Parasedimentitalea maritima]|uniref:Phage tail protein n=1 Tax=Parasedimentitalea maritima TaxID=2578117 RepID=A0ABY2UQD8_9RHOB|nr:phage tail protein [Zongyanglinia marina]
MKKLLASIALASTIFTSLAGTPAQAGETPYIGEISWFAGNFAPRGWAFCDGQLLPVNQYTALFALIGTTYGGDGVTTFALPDMRGRSPVHAGDGPGLEIKKLGQKSSLPVGEGNYTESNLGINCIIALVGTFPSRS